MVHPPLSLLLFIAICLSYAMHVIPERWFCKIWALALGACGTTVFGAMFSIIINLFGISPPFINSKASMTVTGTFDFIHQCIQLIWKILQCVWQYLDSFIAVAWFMVIIMVYYFFVVLLCMEHDTFQLYASLENMNRVFMSEETDIRTDWILVCKDKDEKRLGDRSYEGLDDYLDCAGIVYCKRDPPLSPLNMNVCEFHFYVFGLTWSSLDSTMISTWWSNQGQAYFCLVAFGVFICFMLLNVTLHLTRLYAYRCARENSTDV